jgi:cardiolipin synthase
MSSSPDVTSLNLQRMARARQGSSLRTAPNLLTLLRIALTPFLIAAVLERRFSLAFSLFLVAACTDAMDGSVARLLRQRTMLGQYLDPIADKLLIGSLFLVLTGVGILDPKITVVVFGRDLGMLLSAAIVYFIAGVRDFHPTILGKINSFSQVAAIGIVLLSLIHQQPWLILARQAALNATVTLTVVSGFHYAWVVSQRIGVVADSQTVTADVKVKTGIGRP